MVLTHVLFTVIATALTGVMIFINQYNSSVFEWSRKNLFLTIVLIVIFSPLTGFGAYLALSNVHFTDFTVDRVTMVLFYFIGVLFAAGPLYSILATEFAQEISNDASGLVFAVGIVSAIGVSYLQTLSIAYLLVGL